MLRELSILIVFITANIDSIYTEHCYNQQNDTASAAL